MQMDSSGGQQTDNSFQDEFKKVNKPPKTVKNAIKKIDFDDNNEKTSFEEDSISLRD